jgi:hypothetical protein
LTPQGSPARGRAIAQTGGAAVIVVSMQPLSTIQAARLALLAEIDAHLAALVGPCFVATREAVIDSGECVRAAP